MNIFTVEQQLSNQNQNKKPTQQDHIINNQISSSNSNNQIQQHSRNRLFKKVSTRCLVLFLSISVCFIILCSIFMAIMTTSVFLKTNDLNKDLYTRNKDIQLLLSSTNETSNDPNKLERNVFSWLRKTIKNSFFNKYSKSDDFMDSNGFLLTSKENKLQECGNPAIQPRILSTRIMHGKEAIPNSWPWAVSIGLQGPRENIPHACGGTLLNKRTVLTAAHCVIENSVFNLVGNPSKYNEKFNSVEKMMRIYIGVHDRYSDIKPNNIYGVDQIIMHEQFDPMTFKNDIAVIILDREIEYSDHVGFVCLSKFNQVKPGDSVYAVGWGYTEKSKNQASRYLMQVDLTVQKKENCLIQYLNNDQFCAGNIYQKKDTCNGDSGGPLLKLINNKWTLVGVVSNGDANCGGTGIYINVSYFYDWIMLYSRTV